MLCSICSFISVGGKFLYCIEEVVLLLCMNWQPTLSARPWERKQRAVTEFITAEGVSPIEVHCRMQDVYGDDCPCNIITKVHQRERERKT